MTGFQPGEVRPIPNRPPAPLQLCSEWWDVLYQQWFEHHKLGGKKNPIFQSDRLDKLFLPPKEKADYADLVKRFNTSIVAGRSPSGHRAPLEVYSQISKKDRAEMRTFLNYVISYGESILELVLAVLQHCLRSRAGSTYENGMAPTWVNHQTFVTT
jgi:hypothetical protein